ncbi:MAG: right-handed parallel beta-helix repeat-containing protein [Candidatus Binatus sp.]|uniref:DUF1565 domain-containing protein n=1 Tax=Candidatus Binatus sp. TaxID=2811406 RepID=UPI00271AD9EF|nr:DUF1565 domain-containing protein [Candidatus Binatus sp.]MDO8432698.1 right-handed parallel beta-helix repeat-containing protein [Candidatus Binatus sp.]
MRTQTFSKRHGGALLLAGIVWLASTGAAEASDLRIQQPRRGAIVSGDVAIVLSLSDRTDWCAAFIDGQLLAKSSPGVVSPYTLTWNSRLAIPTWHTISAKTYNRRGRLLAERSVVVSVSRSTVSSPTRSLTPTRTATRTRDTDRTPTRTSTASRTPTRTATVTKTATVTRTATRTRTPTPAASVTPTRTSTMTATPTATPTATAVGTTFYVSPSGSDSNSGLSRTAPWRTIQHAASSLPPGDVAIVMAGTYAERVLVSRSENAGAPITLQADSGAKVITRGFEVRADHVTIAGFEITNQATTEPAGYGVYVAGASNLISGNYLHDLYFEGIMVSGEGNPNSATTAQNLISKNVVVRAAMAGIHLEGQRNTAVGNDISATRQYPSGGPRRSGADADGIRFFGSGHAIRSNHIHDIPYGAAENPDPHVDCFQTWGPASSIMIERNFCVWSSTSASTDNEASSLESLSGASSQISYRSNVFVNMRQGINASDISGLAVLNNTWDNILEEAVILNSSPNASIINNIFYDVGSGSDSYACIDSGSQSGISIASNDHFMSQGSPGNYCSSAPYSSQDPLFADATGMDFHLQKTSSLIDRGTTMSTVPNDYDGVVRPQGAGYDMGAFEYH